MPKKIFYKNNTPFNADFFGKQYPLLKLNIFESGLKILNLDNLGNKLVTSEHSDKEPCPCESGKICPVAVSPFEPIVIKNFDLTTLPMRAIK